MGHAAEQASHKLALARSAALARHFRQRKCTAALNTTSGHAKLELATPGVTFNFADVGEFAAFRIGAGVGKTSSAPYRARTDPDQELAVPNGKDEVFRFACGIRAKF